MVQSLKDLDAKRAVQKAIRGILAETKIEEINVGFREDHTGAPALFVTVSLKSGQASPSGTKLIDSIKAMTDSLLEIGDDRFPYLSFNAPEDNQAEDTRRPAA